MRLLVLPISLLVMLSGCKAKEAPPVETELPKVAADNEEAFQNGESGRIPSTDTSANMPCGDSARASEMHLGDGVTSENYYFITEELQRRPGSAKEAEEVERRQAEAQRSSGESALKPPSAKVVESEFSHLLGAVVDSNGGVGAAVFDAFGLKVGAAGLQLEPMVLNKERLDSAAKVAPGQVSEVQRYSCEQLRERLAACDPLSNNGIACGDLETASQACSGSITAFYRPVLADDDSLVGVSMLVVQEKEPCALVQD